MNKKYRILFSHEGKLVDESVITETSKYQAKKRAKVLAELKNYDSFTIEEEVS
jgi:hypothetical protein